MKKLLILLAAMALTMGVGATAEGLTKTEYNQATSEITVTVSGIESTPAIVYIISGEYDASDDVLERDYVMFKEFYSDGSVACKISSDRPSGEYTVVSSINGKISTSKFWYTSDTFAMTEYLFLSKINSETSWSKFADLITNEYRAFVGIDVSKLNSSGKKESIVKDLMKKTPFDSLKSFQEAYKKLYASYSSSSSSSGSSSGGGGGSSGGSGGYVSVSDATTTKNSLVNWLIDPYIITDVTSVRTKILGFLK